jgi:hypothetical protein
MFLSVIIGSLYNGVQADQCQPTVTMSPEMTAVLVTALSGVLGACVVNPENPNIAGGFCLGAFSAIMGTLASAIKWENSRGYEARRQYYERMMKTFTTLIAPSFLLSGFAVKDEFLRAFGWLATVGTGMAWL